MHHLLHKLSHNNKLLNLNNNNNSLQISQEILGLQTQSLSNSRLNNKINFNNLQEVECLLDNKNSLNNSNLLNSNHHSKDLHNNNNNNKHNHKDKPNSKETLVDLVNEIID